MENKKCSFCGSEIDPNSKYITGGTKSVYMCQNCFNILNREYSEVTSNYSNNNNEEKSETSTILTPSKIKSELDKYIIGQEEAKKTMCTAIYNHYIRIGQSDNDDVIIDKSNICLIGPTGTGKTEIARSIAKLLDVPFAICDATTITQSGYVGEDIESIITRVLQNCDYDVEKAEHAIIVLDEADKLRKTSGNVSITRDVSGEGVQQGLLKMLEGKDAMVPPQGGRKHPEQKLIKVSTKNILFILSGAFVGLDDIIRERLEEEDKSKKENVSTIGFDAVNSYNINNINDDEDDDILSFVQPDDIVKFGMIPEIVGRLPVITHTQQLTKDALRHILTEPVSSIVKQYQKLMKMSNVELTFTNGALDFIAQSAESMGTGARALRTCMEKVMAGPMFVGPDLGVSSNNIYKMRITKSDCVKALGRAANPTGEQHETRKIGLAV